MYAPSSENLTISGALRSDSDIPRPPVREDAQIKYPRGFEPPDSEFRVQYPGHTFFRKGVVFKILWADPARSIPETLGSRNRPTWHEEVRCFVVIREGRDSCICL